MSSVALLKLANHYLVVRTEPSGSCKVLSKQPVELRVAQVALRTFAEQLNLPVITTIGTMSKPIMTVIKRGEQWYPTELHSDRVTQLTHFGPMPLGGTEEQATCIAAVIALSRQSDFQPNWGKAININSDPSIQITCEVAPLA